MSGLNSFTKDVLRGLGLELRRLKYVNSEETVVPAVLAHARPVAVLDVGANVGQYAALVRKLGFEGMIVSFEAIPEVHAQLIAASAGDSKWVVAPCAALGREHRQVEFHIAGNSVSSSVLPMNAAHLDAAPNSAYVGTQVLQMHRLDDLAAGLLPAAGPVVLKIDTQGYEREVLAGSTALLPRVAALQIEVSLVPLYDGAPSFTEMVSFVERLGFAIFSFVPGLRNQKDGRLLQMDAFFIRESSSGTPS
jgi:FkbM family methyltransferase